MSRSALGVCATAALALGVAASAAAQTVTAPAQTRPVLAQAQAPAAQGAAATTTSPTFEVTGGYQVVHVPDETFPFGLNLDGAWNFNPAWALAGEIGWAFKSDDSSGVDTNLHLWNIGVGPRWEKRTGRAWPFAQLLVGGVHARASAEVAGVDVSEHSTKFMIQPGVGVNYLAGDGWGIVGAVDYRRVFLDKDEDGESGENEFRVFIGVRVILD